jgi:hypothetical protein
VVPAVVALVEAPVFLPAVLATLLLQVHLKEILEAPGLVVRLLPAVVEVVLENLAIQMEMVLEEMAQHLLFPEAALLMRVVVAGQLTLREQFRMQD